MMKQNILTFDIEEWYLYEKYPKGGKSYYLPCINGCLDRTLDLLDEAGYKATFYSLGIIAREYPEIIRRIASRGHEIGCHSDKHTLINRMTPREFREDTRIAIDSLQQVTGSKIDLYRAPAFSMKNTWPWALGILAEEGITCDSSIFSSGMSVNGQQLDFNKPFLIHVNGLTLKQLPIGSKKLLGQQFIFSGGGFFRFFPYIWIHKWMNELDYNMTYFHIRDFDTQQKRFLSKRYFLSYYGINGAFDKFSQMIADFDFIPVGDAISQIDWSAVGVIDLK